MSLWINPLSARVRRRMNCPDGPDMSLSSGRPQCCYPVGASLFAGRSADLRRGSRRRTTTLAVGSRRRRAA